MCEATDLLREVQASAPDDLSLTGLLSLPPAARALFLWLVRRGRVGPGELEAFTGLSGVRAAALLRLLVERGVLEPIAGDADSLFRVRLRSARPEHRGRVPGLDQP